MNHSLGKCPEENIDKIVYIGAVVPFPGEAPFELLSEKDNENYFLGIEYDKKRSALIIKNEEEFIKKFAPEASLSQRNYIKKLAITEPSKLGDGKLKFDLEELRGISKYYIHTLA